MFGIYCLFFGLLVFGVCLLLDCGYCCLFSGCGVCLLFVFFYLYDLVVFVLVDLPMCLVDLLFIWCLRCGCHCCGLLLFCDYLLLCLLLVRWVAAFTLCVDCIMVLVVLVWWLR